MTLTYPFKHDEFIAAYESWGCNCGPTALAFATQTSLEAVRAALPDFEKRRYVNPTMMQQAIWQLGWSYERVWSPQREHMFSDRVSLVRIQWTGPWTHPKKQRWASKHTHWIATFRRMRNTAPFVGQEDMVFDCNGGIREITSWDFSIATTIMGTVKDCTGWEPANVWRMVHVPVRQGRRHKGN